MTSVDVQEVARASTALAGVKILWRQHSDTLGYFPDGAFDDYAQRRCILAVVDAAGTVAGYLLFRITGRRQAAIVHLCVRQEARGSGVARRLFHALLDRIPYCTDVVLRCRRDFEAHRLWPRLGFVAMGEGVGRGQRGALLTSFRFVIAQPPLLARLHDAQVTERTRVVVDANVFFDLDDEETGRAGSRALAADWLTDFIELCVTDEILNEVDRNPDMNQRQRQRDRVKLFSVIDASRTREAKIHGDVKALLADGDSDRAESDARHVTRTIAAGAGFFVTRDSGILAAADALYENHGLLVLEPHDVVLRFDELRRVDHYRPRRLFVGPASRLEAVRAGDIEELSALLPGDENRRRRIAQLRVLLAAPDSVEVTCVRVDGELLTAFALDRSAGGVLTVSFFAVTEGGLGGTAAKHFAHRFAAIAADEGRTVVRVVATGPQTEAALANACYLKSGDVWVKVSARGVTSPAELAERVETLAASLPELQPVAEMLALSLEPGLDCEALVELERMVWPAKLHGTKLPCFIVPIRPEWASQLFDHGLAASSLFGSDARLSLNSENAYYRAATGGGLCAPGRILWYVSHDPKQQGTMAVRACSYLEEIITAPPKAAYRAYQHLGVYRWRDVFGVAKNDLSREVQAFRFSKTELLAPVPFAAVREILARHDLHNQQFQSPLQVPEDCFFEVYQAGLRGERAT